MALEEKIDALAATIVSLTEVTQALMALRADAVSAATATKAPAKATKKAEPQPVAVEEKPAAETPKVEEKPAEAPKVEEKPAAAEPQPEITVSPEDRKDPSDPKQAVILRYVGGTDRAEEREARKAKVQKLYGALAGHFKIEVGTYGDIPEGPATAAFIANVEKLIAHGDLTSAAPDLV